MGFSNKVNGPPGDPRLDRFNRRRRWARRLGWLLYGSLFLGLLAGGAGGGYIYLHYIRDLPDFASIKEYRPPVVTRIFAQDGCLMREFFV